MRFNSNVWYKSPGFDINDVGFLRRADTRNIGNWIQFRDDRPNRWFRSRMINFNEYAGWNADGDRLYSGGNINAHAVFANNWSTGGGYNVNGLGLDDRATRGGPAVYMEGGRGVWYYVNSDNRRVVSLNYFGSWFVNSVGGRSRDFNPEFTIRPIPALMVTAGVRYGQEHRRRAVGGGGHGYGEPLRVQPPRPDDGRADRALQLHADAEPVASAVRAAVRLRGRLHRFQGDSRTRGASTTPRASRRSPTTRRPTAIPTST